MEQSPSWKANRFAASQEIPRILWNPKSQYFNTAILLTYLITYLIHGAESFLRS
jgi:hypothetical protein